MKGWWPLFKKEILEQVRTYRLIIVAGVFLFFGLTTPLTLKYLPEIIKLAGESMQITIPPPTAVQSLAEFAGTILQLGVLILILIGMGSIANEYKNGTALLTLSKPVTRAAFVTAKMAALSLNLVVSLLVSGLVCFAYTAWLIGPADIGPFMLQNALLCLFLIFCLSLTLLFSSLFKSGLAAGGLAMAVIVFQAILSSLPHIGDYLPGRLPGWGLNILNGSAQPNWWALTITLGLVVLCLFLAQMILKKKEA
jgi:ABC-2 type transport system permease protein